MLIKYDDFPIQQTTESLAYVASSDRNAYGRYWFNGYSPDGEFYFGAAFGIYPNREVMDCALSIVHKGGQQHSFFASRRCPRDRSELRVGPFTLSIVEPMRTLRITLDDNTTGITADLTFRARSPAHEEPTDLQRRGNRVVMNTKRYTQFGTWEGFIQAGGRRQDMDPKVVLGTRDRSWGWRQVGEAEGGAPPQKARQVFWLWAPLHWDDHCSHYGLFENADGSRWKEFADIIPAHPTNSGFDVVDDSGIEAAAAGQHRLQFEPGSRFVSHAEIDLLRGKETMTISLEPLLRFHMLGIGYFHPDWSHGTWHGEEAIHSESWKVADLDRQEPRHQHIQQVVRARCGDRVGVGVLEQAIQGPHERYGLTGATTPPK
ncbi:MAG: hypothetical protein ABI574_00585 [Burkholderiales bacterium]